MNSLSHGVLNLLKPPGMTSHDAVAWARRVLQTKRVGHTGTLDPAAAGVLPLCVGQATRLVESLQAGTKGYLAEATFGFETNTLDAVGQTMRSCDASGLEREQLEDALENFRGDIMQKPPLHSAIKIGGRRLYEIAREGGTIEIPARPVTISRLQITRFFAAGADSRPRALLEIECSGGTYIRSLVRDIGRELGLAATMTFLTRTRSGLFRLENAQTWAEFEAAPRLLALEELLQGLASATLVDDDLVAQLWQGRRIELQIPKATSPVLLANRDRTLFSLAVPAADPSVTDLPAVSSGSRLYKAEKVFDLRVT